MRFGPPVRVTRNTRGTRLAYQVLGDGPPDLVFLFGWPTHSALSWENPAFAEFLHGLASFSRLILFDRAGTGMSDRGPTGNAFEDFMDDIRAVLGAVGSEQAAFFGCHLGGRLALLFAATHPQQTSAVVTFAAHPATLRDANYPWGSNPQEREGLLHAVESNSLDLEDVLEALAPPTPPIRRRGAGGTPIGGRPPAPSRAWTRSAPSDRSTSAGSCPPSACRPCCCTGPGIVASTWAPAGTWPGGCRRPPSSSCRAATTSRSSATRTRSW